MSILWTKRTVRIKLKCTRFDFRQVIVTGSYPANLNHNRELFAAFNRKYPGLLKNTTELIFIAKNCARKEQLASEMFCKECGKRNKIAGHKQGFNTYCSQKCARSSELRVAKTRQTVKRKYGVDCITQCESFKEKSHKTKVKRYGRDYTKCQAAKAKETMKKRYGVECAFQAVEVRKKIKKYFQSNFGVDNPSQLDSVKLKKVLTSRENYGVDHPMQSRKIRKKVVATLEKKYGIGIKAPAQNSGVLLKMQQTCFDRYGCITPFQNNAIKRKIRKTFRSKYGVDNPSKAEAIKAKIKESSKNKRGKSSIEDALYEVLKDIFSNVHRQYWDERYPFLCDFYIPEIDLFIEYQGYFAHGSEAYNKRKNAHKELLIEYQKKAKKNKFYSAFIKHWTIRDPLKRSTARKNGLNYLEFFNLNQFYTWLYDWAHYKEAS